MSLSFNVASFTEDTIVYKEIPVDLSLKINKERVFMFTNPVEIWLPDNAQSLVNVESVGRNLYITALNHFTKIRIRVRSIEDESFYIFNLKIVNENNVISDLLKVIHHNELNRVDLKQDALYRQTNLDPRLYLIRYAAQQLYAPQRLLKPDPNVIAMAHSKTELPHLIRGGFVRAMAIASWKNTNNSLYVTAIRLENISNKKIQINHEKDIRGNFLVSALQHTYLESKNVSDVKKDHSNVTTLYVVGEQEFGGVNYAH